MEKKLRTLDLKFLQMNKLTPLNKQSEQKIVLTYCKMKRNPKLKFNINIYLKMIKILKILKQNSKNIEEGLKI